MILLGLLLALCACGASPAPPKPVALAVPKAMQTRTVAERKASVCAREHLIALEPAWLPSPTAPKVDGIVRKVSVMDAATKQNVDIPGDALSRMRIGEPFSPESAREVSRRLWKTGRFDDIAVDTDTSAQNVAVVFRVTKKRTIAEVFSTGADVEPWSPWLSALHLATGAIYDPVAVVSAGYAFADSLGKRGYLDAALSLGSDFSDDTHTAVDICVRFEPGPQITLDKIDVRGSAHSAALSALVAREDDKNVHGAVIDGDVLERDLLVMAAWLYDQGLLAHKIDKTIERKGELLTIVLTVTDGAVYRYSGIDVRGDLLAPKPEYMKLIKQRRGDVFSRTTMMKVIDDAKALHKTLGREDLEVEPETELDPAKNTVSIVIAIHDPKKKRVH